MTTLYQPTTMYRPTQMQVISPVPTIPLTPRLVVQVYEDPNFGGRMATVIDNVPFTGDIGLSLIHI